MHQVRYAVWVAVVVASLCLTAPATHQGGHVVWATAKGTLRVAVVGFDRVHDGGAFDQGDRFDRLRDRQRGAASGRENLALAKLLQNGSIAGCFEPVL